MKIYFAADHAGVTLKETLVPFVRDELGYDIEDCGARTLDASDDYPLIIAAAASRVSADAARGEESRAIILGKSGQGEAMVANRFRGVRAAVFYGGVPDIITLSREHNNANALSLGAGFLSEDEAKEAVRLWLATPFSGEERHARRIEGIETATADTLAHAE